MIDAFKKLTSEQRSAEAEKRLDETLERMAEIHPATVSAKRIFISRLACQ